MHIKHSAIQSQNKMRLSKEIKELNVEQCEIAVFYLAQAGFCIKSSGNKIIVIDAYLSDAVERLFSFKRMIPSMLRPDEVGADLYLSTHSHADHLDPDALPVLPIVRKFTYRTTFRMTNIKFSKREKNVK
jgi:hypothetical protein